jgi:hypothetical protein
MHLSVDAFEWMGTIFCCDEGQPRDITVLDLALKLMEGLYENYNTMNCAVCR